MTFKIKFNENKQIEKRKIETIKKLNNFYKTSIEENKIQIISLDKKSQEILNPGNSGWSTGDYIFILNKKDYLKKNPSKKPEARYSALITHEISHVYFKKIAKKQIPLWLNEGLAIFLSEQNQFKEKPKEFSHFLDCYEKANKEVYQEAGFFIEKLINIYGKEKILEILNNLKNIENEKQFAKLFKKVYKFELNYQEANKLLTWPLT